MMTRSRQKALHLLVGFACQNDCVFCCDGGFGRFPRTDAARVRSILERNAALESVEFTQHEPTLNPDLVQYVTWARELGFRIISVVTNGRSLGRGTLLERLVEAGLSRVRISLHGDRADVHDRLTRRAGSFDQAVAAIRAVVEMRKQRRLSLTLHSTVTALNVDRLPRMVPFVLAFSPDHYGLNAVFPVDREGENTATYMVRHSQIVDALRRCLPQSPLLPVTLSEIPPCQVLGRLPGAYLGIREDFHLAASPADSPEATSAGGRPGFVFGPRCAPCAARAICDGVSERYAESFGWDELRPLERRPGRIQRPSAG
jgi:molybdenum cofactor biosynthesis enzyme MoaA